MQSGTTSARQRIQGQVNPRSICGKRVGQVYHRIIRSNFSAFTIQLKTINLQHWRGSPRILPGRRADAGV